MTDRNSSQNYYERENCNTFQDHGRRRNINIIIGTNMKEGFIIHFRTMEIEKILKIVMKTSIGMKISMTVINPMT